MQNEEKILNYQKEKKDIKTILVIGDFIKYKEIDFLPFFALGAEYGLLSSDIVFKDYRDFIHTLKLSDLEYSKDYKAIISINVPEEEFNNSFLGELAKDEDLYQIYPYFLYTPIGKEETLTSEVFESALENVMWQDEHYYGYYDTCCYFLTNRKPTLKGVAKEFYHVQERWEALSSFGIDLKGWNREAGKLIHWIDRKVEQYYSKNAAYLVLIVRKDSDSDTNPYREIVCEGEGYLFSYYFFAPSEKLEAKSLASKLMKDDPKHRINNIWIAYTDKEGRRYDEGLNQIYSRCHYVNTEAPAIPVSEKIRLYNNLALDPNFD